MPWCCAPPVADAKFGQVLDQRFVADLFLPPVAPARGGACGEQLGLGDEINVFKPAEPVFSAAVAMPIFSLLVWKSSSESKAGGLRLLARRSKKLAPGRLSASTSTRWRCFGVALEAGQRLAPRTTAILTEL
jgi:hypothetical protein